MDAWNKRAFIILQYFDIQHIQMLNMQHKNLMIPPESEPTLFAAGFKMSRMQFPMIWDAGLEGGTGENTFK